MVGDEGMFWGCFGLREIGMEIDLSVCCVKLVY